MWRFILVSHYLFVKINWAVLNYGPWGHSLSHSKLFIFVIFTSFSNVKVVLTQDTRRPGSWKLITYSHFPAKKSPSLVLFLSLFFEIFQKSILESFVKIFCKVPSKYFGKIFWKLHITENIDLKSMIYASNVSWNNMQLADEVSFEI